MKLKSVLLSFLLLSIVSCGTDESEEMVSTDETVVITDDGVIDGDDGMDDMGDDPQNTDPESSDSSINFPKFIEFLSGNNEFKQKSLAEASQTFVTRNITEESGIAQGSFQSWVSDTEVGVYKPSSLPENSTAWLRGVDDTSGSFYDLPGWASNELIFYKGQNSSSIVRAVLSDSSLSRIEIIDKVNGTVQTIPFEMDVSAFVHGFDMTENYLVIGDSNNDGVKYHFFDLLQIEYLGSVDLVNTDASSSTSRNFKIIDDHYYVSSLSGSLIDIYIPTLSVTTRASQVLIDRRVSVLDNERIFCYTNGNLATQNLRYLNLTEVKLFDGAKTSIDTEDLLVQYADDNDLFLTAPILVMYSKSQNVWILKAQKWADNSGPSSLVYLKINQNGEILSELEDDFEFNSNISDMLVQ